MFETFDKKARRVVFCARYEAAQLGSHGQLLLFRLDGGRKVKARPLDLNGLA